MKKKWKITKILKLNYLIWGTFLVGVSYQLIKAILINNGTWVETEHFNLTNMSSWKAMDYLTAIPGAVLLLELIALMKDKGVDMVKSAKDIKNIHDDGEDNE